MLVDPDEGLDCLPIRCITTRRGRLIWAIGLRVLCGIVKRPLSEVDLLSRSLDLSAPAIQQRTLAR